MRARDYLNGYGPFGRYNFFNISTPIGAGRRPLKDHPSTKVGRLPRRHRKTPSSGSGAAPVISRKPHHFACIIHSNSPGSPLAAQRRISRRDRKEATRNAIISPPCPRLHEKQSFLLPTVVIGMSLCSATALRHSRNIADDILRGYSNSFHVLIYIMLTFAVGRSFCTHATVLYYFLQNVEGRRLLIIYFKPVLRNKRECFTCIVS